MMMPMDQGWSAVDRGSLWRVDCISVGEGQGSVRGKRCLTAGRALRGAMPGKVAERDLRINMRLTDLL
jgi:hypothetical protein